MEHIALVGSTPAVTLDSTVRQYDQWMHRAKKLLVLLYIGANVALVVLMFTYIALHLGSPGNICDLGLTAVDSDIIQKAAFGAGEEPTQAGLIAVALYTLFSLNPMPIRIFWGPFAFSTVKTMDIFWNLLVGRGGQFIAGFFTLRTLTAWLIQTMTSCPVPHDMFMESVFSRGSSLSALWQFTRPKAGSLVWRRHKFQLVTFALCIAYVLSLPTLNSAATGYMAQSEVYLREHDGTLERLDEKEWMEAPEILVVIENGHLIGQSDPVYFWTGSDSDVNGFAKPGDPPTMTFSNDTSLIDEFRRLHDNCEESCNVFHSLHSGNFTFPANETLKTRFMASMEDYNASDPVTIFQDQFFTRKDTIDLMVCVSMDDSYFWGFSYHLLLLWSVLNLFHGVALCLTWSKLSRNRGIRTNYGIHRAAVDYTEMAQDVMEVDIHTKSDKELEKTLHHRKVGLVISDPHDRVSAHAWSSNSEVEK